MELFTNLAFGFGVAMTLSNLAYCLLGVTIGTLVGILPGIGPLATIAMLLPITFGLDPVGSLIMLAGIYYGAQFGSSVTAMLLNMPSHAAAAVVCLDGYPMAKQGRAAEGLVMSALASFVGGSIAIVLVMTLAPPLASFALRFGPAEYASMMILGLVAAAVLSQGSLLKGLAMVLLGLAIGLVGIDVNSGVQRYTFGSWHLTDGISFVIIAMGFFAISEIMSNLETRTGTQIVKASFAWGDLIPSAAILRRAFPSMLRGTAVGAIFGPLPGSGPTLASFISYSLEKRVARDPSRFGKGAIEGVTAPEASNNTAAVTGFIPTLTLGIPGDAIMALLLGALMIHGITPGPRVITDHPELFWGLVASMWIGNVILLVLNIPLIGLWVRVLSIPYSVLCPTILLLICIGVFSTSNNPIDIVILAAFGVIGYIFYKLDCPAAPLLLGVILGPLIEENLRRALLISLGDATVFVTRPISLVLLLCAFFLIIGFIITSARRKSAS